MNNAILTGQTTEHLVPILDNDTVHYLQKEAAWAFRAWQEAATQAGFQLTIASSFRDFERQKMIWNGKFLGKRKVHDDAGNPINMEALDDWQKCQAILRFSACPGLSRHHWGTDMDLYDPSRLPEEQKLQLEPFEYNEGGYFYDFSCWLQQSATEFGFFAPFLNLPAKSKMAEEPWHYSYAPLSHGLQQQMNEQILKASWQGSDIVAKDLLESRLHDIYYHYFV